MEDQTDNRPPEDSSPRIVPKELPLAQRLRIHPVLFALLSLAIIFILYQIVGGVLTLLLFGIKPTPESLTGYRISTGAGQLIFILVPTMILVRFATFEPKKFLRLSAPAFKPVVVSIFSVIALEQMMQIFLAFQEKLPFPEIVQKMMDEFKQIFEELYKFLLTSNSLAEFIFVVTIVALIPSIVEEILFRGLIQRSIEKTTSPYRSAIITGIIFGAYHFNPFSFVPLAALGIFLGFLTVRTGSVWTSVVVHFVNNFLACLAVYYNLDDDFVGFGTAKSMSNAELLFAFWVFGMIFIVSILYLLKITKQKTVEIKPINYDSSISPPGGGGNND